MCLTKAPSRKSSHKSGGDAQPGVDRDELSETMDGEKSVNNSGNDDANGWRSKPGMQSRELLGQESVLGQREGHARGCKDGAVQQANVRHRSRQHHCESKPWPANLPRGV